MRLSWDQTESAETLQSTGSPEPIPAPTVFYDPHQFTSFQLVGKDVGWVRETLVDILNVPSTALPVVNGAVQDDSYPLEQGDRLFFLFDQGVKGLGRLLTKAQLVDEWGISDRQYQEPEQRWSPLQPP